MLHQVISSALAFQPGAMRFAASSARVAAASTIHLKAGGGFPFFGSSETRGLTTVSVGAAKDEVAELGGVSLKGVVAPEPSGDITKADVTAAQKSWANAIKGISKTFLNNGDYIGAAAAAAGELYGYGHSNVLFKPTKAAEYPFRPTAGEAMSYFVGGGVVDGGYDEDGGFAINGGKGWKDVVFTNHQVELNGNVAIAMGSYVFTCATSGDKAKVEYTFGYKKNDDGKMRIFLHHSSVPYAA